MHNIKSILVLILAFFINNGFGKSRIELDSTYWVEGVILNAETKEPVKAKITYESQPYSNKIGVLNDSKFSFVMSKGDFYIIYVEAKGFITTNEKISYSEANSDGKILKKIYLLPEGKNKVMRLEQLLFAQGKYQIQQESFAELNRLAAMLDKNPSMKIQLEGHTDFRGNPKQNMKLSQKRVQAVKDYLASKGLAKRRIKTKAFGGTKPLSKENDATSHKKNRRVEVRILKN